MTAQETISGTPVTVDPADWVTIWQSELAALAVDRECADALLLWGQAWVDAAEPSGGRDDEPSRGRDDEPSRGRSGPDAPAGAAPVGAAPDVERELQWLRNRVAELGG